VLADRAGWPNGLAHALENRRRLGRILPELFASHLLCPLEHFAGLWQDALQRLVPPADGDPGGVALLTPGHADSDWFGHVLLARELNCALVECGDLTVRGGRLFLKTLRGLQPIGVLLRGEHGNRIDPLELSPDAGGVPGLLEAARDGGVRIVNYPGSSLVEAPALAAFLPALARHMLGEELALPGVETHWLDDLAPNGPAAREAVLRNPDAWLVRPAFDANAPPATFATLPPQARAGLLARIAAGQIRGADTDHAVRRAVPRQRPARPEVIARAGVPGLRGRGVARDARRPRLRHAGRRRRLAGRRARRGQGCLGAGRGPARYHRPAGAPGGGTDDPAHRR
jgi:uncharacterized circularly permuted ATP-grasp superfamily protein